MFVQRYRFRSAAVVLAAFLALAVYAPAPPAFAAGDGGGSFFEQLLSIFAPQPPRNQPNEPPTVTTSRHSGSGAANPMFPYAGGRESHSQASGTYRTVCVRLCDGYYWPVSQAASESRFNRDRNICQSSCEQPAKLFYAPQDQTDASELISLDGSPYSSLATAFAYRKALHPECQCKPSPWADSEIARHQQYAAEQQVNSVDAGMNATVNATDSPEQIPTPLPDTDGQQGNPAATAAEKTTAANADPMPIVLNSNGAGGFDVPVVAGKKARRIAGAQRNSAQTQIPDPSSFSVETIDRFGQRYIPLR